MPEAAPSVGQVLGHYRLIEQIGAGGMGVVFRARDEQLRRDVALKVINPGLFSDEASRERFRNEALAVGRLTHPNVAMAFDFGADSGVDYLVTEYIPGVSLEEKIGKEPLAQKTVLEMGIQLLSGLEAAHRENVVHRDLKPANIRLSRDGQLKILDFGLAKLVDGIDEDGETAGISSKLSVTGTVPYMAPELLRGEVVDARADIWATGAVLYEMATGKRAFPDKQPSLLIDAILHYDPVRPQLINPEVSPALEAIILRALDRDRERRYQNAAEMRADLLRVQAGDEIATATLNRTRGVEAAAQARRRILILGVVALLAVGTAIGYFAKRWWPATNNRQHILAVLPIEAVGQDAGTTALGMGLTETLAAKLAEAGEGNSLQIISPRDLRDQNVKTAQEAMRDFGADLVLESSLQREGQTIRINSSLVDPRTHRQLAARTITAEASDSFGLQDRVVSEALDMLPSPTAPEQRRKLTVRQDTQPAAYEAYIRGRGYLLEFSKPEDIDSAVAEFNRAIQIDPNYALAYAALGNTYLVGAQQYFRGNDWIAKASQSCNKALSLNPELVEGHVCLGNVYDATGKYDKAVEEFERAVRADPSNEDVLRGLADTFTNIGNYTAAESAYQRAVGLRPNYWAPYSWLGAFYFGQSRYADAAAAFLKATELAPDNYLTYVNLGGAYVLEGRYADAIEASKHSIALRPTPEAYNNLGYALMLTGKTDEAIDALEKALAIDDRDWMNWGNLGDALYWSSNRRNEAAGKYRKAVAIASSKLQVNSSDVPTLAYLANYSAMLGEKDAALQYLYRALRLAPANGDVLFRAALVYNHFGQSDETLSYLSKAVQAGYSRTVIRDTPDFRNLHDNSRFHSLVGAG